MTRGFHGVNVALALLFACAIAACLWLASAGGTRWRYRCVIVVLGVLLVSLSFWSAELAVLALPATVLQAATATCRVWFVSVNGWQGHQALKADLARHSSVAVPVCATLAKNGLIAGLGALLAGLSAGEDDWAYWIGLGIVCHSAWMAGCGVWHLLRLYRRVGAKRVEASG